MDMDFSKRFTDALRKAAVELDTKGDVAVELLDNLSDGIDAFKEHATTLIENVRKDAEELNFLGKHDSLDAASANGRAFGERAQGHVSEFLDKVSVLGADLLSGIHESTVKDEDAPLSDDEAAVWENIVSDLDNKSGLAEKRHKVWAFQGKRFPVESYENYSEAMLDWVIAGYETPGRGMPMPPVDEWFINTPTEAQKKQMEGLKRMYDLLRGTRFDDDFKDDETF